MTESQKILLVDICKQSSQGIKSVMIGNNGNLVTDTPQNLKIVNDLQTLQNDEYITGVGSGIPKLDGSTHYLFSSIKITTKGIKFVESLK